MKYKDAMDLIICSNGGIIPIEFEDCYPFLTYDAHGNSRYDKLYIMKTYARLKLFFEKFQYEFIIFNFRPNLRNVYSARMFKKTSANPHNIYIYPSKRTYELARRNNFKPKGSYYPDCSFECMEELNQIIQEIQMKKEVEY